MAQGQKKQILTKVSWQYCVEENLHQPDARIENLEMETMQRGIRITTTFAAIRSIVCMPDRNSKFQRKLALPKRF